MPDKRMTLLEWQIIHCLAYMIHTKALHGKKLHQRYTVHLHWLDSLPRAQWLLGPRRREAPEWAATTRSRRRSSTSRRGCRRSGPRRNESLLACRGRWRVEATRGVGKRVLPSKTNRLFCFETDLQKYVVHFSHRHHVVILKCVH